MIVVVDASVALKWFFRDRADESRTEDALAILGAVDAQRLTMIQPPHFVAEVAAVLAREKPDGAHRDLADLQQIDWRIHKGEDVYRQSIDLAIESRQHMFDTLYHAVALRMSEATLVTADRRYFRRAQNFGRITLLGEFSITDP